MALVGLEMELHLEDAGDDEEGDGEEWCLLRDVIILEGMTVVALDLGLESLVLLGTRN